MNPNFTLLIIPDKGTGVFSNEYFEPENLIGVFIQDTPNPHGRKLTEGLWESSILGRFCNHSERPNATLVQTETGYSLYANRYIDKGDEITVSYHVVEYKLGKPRGEYYKSSFVDTTYSKYGKLICEF
jgi:hypothetical protein